MSGWVDGALVVVGHSTMDYDFNCESMTICHMKILYS